jgi:hypothetical protein
VSAPVIEAGVDTWRLLFKTTRANGAEITKLDRWSAHWIPALSLYCVEGHPSADGLCPGDGLASAYAEVSRALDSEVGSYEFRGVSRLDTTATYRFGDGREGVALLGGLASLDWPRLKPVVWGKPPETVGLTARDSRTSGAGGGRRGVARRASLTVAVESPAIRKWAELGSAQTTAASSSRRRG